MVLALRQSKCLRIELTQASRAAASGSCRLAATQGRDWIERAHLEGYRHLTLVVDSPAALHAVEVCASTAQAAGWSVALTIAPEVVNLNWSLALATVVHTWVLRINSGSEAMTGDPALARHSALAHALEVLRARGARIGFLCSLAPGNLNDLMWVTHLATQQNAVSLTAELAPFAFGEATAQTRLSLEQRVWTMLVLARTRQRYPHVQFEVDLADVELVRHEPERLLASPLRVPAVDTKLAELVSPLVVAANGTLMPLLANLSPRFALGDLANAPLGDLVARWKREKAMPFRQFCQRLHTELCGDPLLPFFSWTEQLVLHSRRLDAVAACGPAPRPAASTMRSSRSVAPRPAHR